MIKFYIIGQTIRCSAPAIAAQSLNYLTASFHFADEDWEGYSKWAHFRQGETVYDFALDENDQISADMMLNLTVGQWEVYLTASNEEGSRITTTVFILTVFESGLIDEPLHPLPLSVAEQVDSKAQTAMDIASALKQAADNGDFDGRDGTSLAPLGHFESAAELENIITEPSPGDVYSVGTEPPYKLYVWDGVNLIWRDHGQLQGAPGADGDKGATFTPSVDANGNISWSNDGGLENPVTRNIMGPRGEDGARGDEGPGAFEKAQEAGYTGTEATFYSALTMMPYHNQRHLPDGADPVVIRTGNMEDGAVTPAKLSTDAKSRGVAVTLAAGSWSSKTQTVSVSGVTADNNVLVAPAPASRTAYNDAEIYCSAQASGKLTFKCSTVPTAAVTVNVVILP